MARVTGGRRRTGGGGAVTHGFARTGGGRYNTRSSGGSGLSGAKQGARFGMNFAGPMGAVIGGGVGYLAGGGLGDSQGNERVGRGSSGSGTGSAGPLNSDNGGGGGGGNDMALSGKFRGVLDRAPDRFQTRNSSLGQDGMLRMDPSVRGLQDEALGTFRGLRDRLGENRDAFMEARVAPLQRQADQRRAGLRRELGRTGVRGSFANQSLNQLDLQSEQRLSEERAKAEMDSINAERAIAQDINSVGSERFAQELKGLGLSAEVTNNLMAIASNHATGQRSNAIRADLGRRRAKLEDRRLDQERDFEYWDRLAGAAGGLYNAFA